MNLSVKFGLENSFWMWTHTEQLAMFTDDCVPRFCFLQNKSALRLVSIAITDILWFMTSKCCCLEALCIVSTPQDKLTQSTIYTKSRNLVIYVHCSVSQTQSWPTPHLTSVSWSTLAPACSRSSATWSWPSWQAAWSGVHPSCKRINNTDQMYTYSQHIQWCRKSSLLRTILYWVS